MKKIKRLSAMLLASAMTIGAVTSVSANAITIITGFGNVEKSLEGLMEIPTSETELFGKSYMPQHPDATYFIGHDNARLVSPIESGSLNIHFNANTDIADIKNAITEICPEAVISEGDKISEDWTTINVKGFEGKLPFSQAKEKYITFDKSIKIYNALSEITSMRIFKFREESISNVSIPGYLTGYYDGIATDPDGTTHEYLCREQIENYIAENYPDWHINLEYNDNYDEFNPMDYSVEPNSEATIEEHYKIANEIYKLTGYIPDLSATSFDLNYNTSMIEVNFINNVKGDANNDGEVNLADVVKIMQATCNSSRGYLSAQGAYNADVTGNGDGITNKDALAIQMYKLGLIDSFE